MLHLLCRIYVTLEDKRGDYYICVEHILKGKKKAFKKMLLQPQNQSPVTYFYVSINILLIRQFPSVLSHWFS
jgi:hypothetical protein